MPNSAPCYRLPAGAAARVGKRWGDTPCARSLTWRACKLSIRGKRLIRFCTRSCIDVSLREFRYKKAGAIFLIQFQNLPPFCCPGHSPFIGQRPEANKTRTRAIDDGLRLRVQYDHDCTKSLMHNKGIHIQ